MSSTYISNYDINCRKPHWIIYLKLFWIPYTQCSWDLFRNSSQWVFAYEGDERDISRNLSSIKRFMYLVGTVSTCFVLLPHTYTLIPLLPPSLMSLIKDLSPCVSLWASLRSQLLHPWNWRLEWILSPLISFVPIFSGSLYCSVLTFSLGSIHEEVVSFCQRNYISVAIFQQTDPWHLIPNRRRLSVPCLEHIAIPSFIYFNYHTFPFCATETCHSRSLWVVSFI